MFTVKIFCLTLSKKEKVTRAEKVTGILIVVYNQFMHYYIDLLPDS